MNVISKEVFSNCHELVDKAGFTRTRAAEIMGLSASTVGRIVKCSTYDEYVEAARTGYRPLIEKSKPEVKPVIPAPTTVTVQATHYMMEELRTMNEHLRIISHKLAFIVDELTGKKEEE